MRRPGATLKRTILAAFVGSVVLTLILVAFAVHFRELSDASALDVAQVARNLASGKGYTTSAPTPLSLAVVPRLDGHPELSRPPAYIVVLAAAIRAFGAKDRVVVLTSTLFLALCALLTYVLAARLFSRAVGVIAVFALISMPAVPGGAFSGTDAMFLALLVTVLFLVLATWCTGDGGHDYRFAIAAGAVCGLAWLTRQEMLLLLVVALVFVARHRRGRALRPMLLVFLVFSVIISPWLWHSYRLTGRPIASLSSYELVMDTSRNPGPVLYLRFQTPTMHPLREALSQPLPIVRKVLRGLYNQYGLVPGTFNPYLLAFFIAGIPLAVTRRRHGLLQMMVVLGFVLTAVMLSLYGNVNAVVLSLVPVTTVFAAGWLVELLEDAVGRLHRLRRTASAARRTRGRSRRIVHAVALCAVTLFLMVPLGPFLFAQTPPYTTPITAAARTLATRPEHVLISDAAVETAWHTDKVVVPLPESPATLARMEKSGLKFDALYLSPAALQFPPSERLLPWMDWLSRDDSPAKLVEDEALAGRMWRLDG